MKCSLSVNPLFFSAVYTRYTGSRLRRQRASRDAVLWVNGETGQLRSPTHVESCVNVKVHLLALGCGSASAAAGTAAVLIVGELAERKPGASLRRETVSRPKGHGTMNNSCKYPTSAGSIASIGVLPVSAARTAVAGEHLGRAANTLVHRFKFCNPCTQSLEPTCQTPVRCCLRVNGISCCNTCSADEAVFQRLLILDLPPASAVVFFDVAAGGQPLGRIEMEVRVFAVADLASAVNSHLCRGTRACGDRTITSCNAAARRCRSQDRRELVSGQISSLSQSAALLAASWVSNALPFK